MKGRTSILFIKDGEGISLDFQGGVVTSSKGVNLCLKGLVATHFLKKGSYLLKKR